jgi:hypothetical protein
MKIRSTGYSGTPLAKKLGIKAGHAVTLLNAPKGFERTLDGLAQGVTLVESLSGKEPFDVIVVFVDSTAKLAKQFDRARAKLDQAGGLWVAWPKKSSGVKTDLTEDVIRDMALAAGMVDNKVCAIDETWSGLRVVVRVKDRKK